MPDSSSQLRLLFIYLKSMPFVEEDLALLRSRYDVRVFHFDVERAQTLSGFAGLLIEQVRWLMRELPTADLVYGWFGDYHLLLPVLLGKLYRVPVVVPIAGFDAIHLPALDYGVYDSAWRRRIVQVVYRGAQLLLPVSETMIYTENRYSAYPETLANGVKAHVPNLQTPYKVIPFGYVPGDWPMGPAERDPIVSTVGFMPDDRTFRRKGVDLLIEAARRMPDVQFEVIGVPMERHAPIQQKYQLPPNVTLHTPVPREALPAMYGRASVYAQLSRAEGQPNVLSEAMCCGCIPVGSNVFGIPETIGEAGFVVEVPEIDTITAALRQALEGATPEAREAARARIIEGFSLERRQRHLLGTLSQL